MGYSKQLNPRNFLVGQIADSNPSTVFSKVNANATLKIPFGIAMKVVAGGYDLPAASGDITNRMAVNAIASRTQNAFYNTDGDWVAGDTDGTAPTVTAVGLTMGTIAVVVEDAVTQGGQCFIRFAQGTPTVLQKGAFRSDADVVSSAATAAAHPAWYYATSASAGGTALVYCK